MTLHACSLSIRLLLIWFLLTLLTTLARAGDNTTVSLEVVENRPQIWTIADVVGISIENHPLVKQAEAEVAAAVARKGQAQSAWYPSMNVRAGYNRTRTWYAASQLNLTREIRSIRGGVDWMLYDFGRTGGATSAADALASASRANALTTEHDVAFAAKVAFFNVMRASHALELQQKNLGHREALFRQAQAFYQAGVRAKIDFVRAEANLYDSRASFGQAKNDLRVARIILLQRMGLDLSTEFVLQGEFEEETISGEMADWIDRQISKLVLGQTMTTDAGSSRSQSETHDKVRDDIADSDIRQVIETIHTTALTVPYINFNFGAQEDYPRIELFKPDEKNVSLVIEAVSKLGPQGFRVKADLHQARGDETI